MKSGSLKWVLGLVYIFVVAAIWIAASFVVQSVVDAAVMVGFVGINIPSDAFKRSNEAIENGVAKLGRVQRSLNCGNCGKKGHNIKTCRSHLPPKNAAASRTKRKAVGEPFQTQTKSKKKALLSADELREKASQKAKNAREKMAARRAAKRAEKLDANRPTRGRPPTRDLGWFYLNLWYTLGSWSSFVRWILY